MGKLMEAFDKQIGKTTKGQYTSNTGTITYSTGFQNLDYLNAYWVHVNGNNKNYKYLLKGIPDGKTIEIIGRSHTGKTSLAIQIAANIIRPFKNSNIFHWDCEGGTNDMRYEILTGFNGEELKEKYRYKDASNGVTLESFYTEFKTIHDIKLENKEEYSYDTGYDNIYGERIYKLIPTVGILDSIPQLLPENVLQDDNLGSNMLGATTAKRMSDLLKRVVNMGMEANIILISINHIMDDVQTGVFAKKPKISGLKMGEKIPGGTINGYLANTLIRVDDGPKLKADEAFGIDGFIGSFQTIKSRSNGSLKTTPAVFNKDYGWSNVLSLLQLLKINDKIHGAGSYQYIGNLDSIKFSQKTFIEKLSKYPQLQIALAQEAFPILESYVSQYEESANDNYRYKSNIDNILDKLSRGEIIEEYTNDIHIIDEKSSTKKNSKKNNNPLDILGDNINNITDIINDN